MIMLVIVVMGVITMLLRFLPLVLANKAGDGAQMHPFLERLPLAVLSAITIPGVFQVDESNPLVGIAASVVAVLLVLVKKIPLFLVVVLSVAAAVLVKML
ncbi:Branched-chain amino acid transport protein (AzlD) [Fontibacillus panacisegetis]|uniref:Branched-chain amino acid transport protein (AzlD) n=1 Tax=Fontibacillus panacisegetis TaxID=670482 RepID=A0A1G7KH04_9BACL|nr:AzlD domain-containing protein [Fontibacillus panacisegetis]SDF36294.1 Branched-chain amino acid transport protein (AzlD) [Fontibacillus panacisegetis]